MGIVLGIFNSPCALDSQSLSPVILQGSEMLSLLAAPDFCAQKLIVIMAYPSIARVESPILHELVATGGAEDVRYLYARLTLAC